MFKLIVLCTDSIRPSLQFSFFILLIWLLSRDRLFTRIFIFTTASVKRCVVAIKVTPTSFYCCYIFLSFGINDSNTFQLRSEYRLSRC